MCVTDSKVVIISDQGLMYLTLDGLFETFAIKGAEDIEPANMRKVKHLDKNIILVALLSGEVLHIDVSEPPVLRRRLTEHKN